MTKRHGRHTAAFLLLFLADGPAYGAMLMARMLEDIPYCLSDSAIVYRSLQELEKNGLVDTRWETPDSGQPKKWYTINTTGMVALRGYAQDIRQRQANFDFFMSQYETIADKCCLAAQQETDDIKGEEK